MVNELCGCGVAFKFSQRAGASVGTIGEGMDFRTPDLLDFFGVHVAEERRPGRPGVALGTLRSVGGSVPTGAQAVESVAERWEVSGGHQESRTVPEEIYVAKEDCVFQPPPLEGSVDQGFQSLKTADLCNSSTRPDEFVDVFPIEGVGGSSSGSQPPRTDSPPRISLRKRKGRNKEARHRLAELAGREDPSRELRDSIGIQDPISSHFSTEQAVSTNTTPRFVFASQDPGRRDRDDREILAEDWTSSYRESVQWGAVAVLIFKLTRMEWMQDFFFFGRGLLLF